MLEVVEAKARLGRADASRLAKNASKVVVAKGKSVVAFDMKTTAADDATLVAAMLGPTGNLRAPTIRIGKTILVGFHDAMYAAALE